MALFTSVSRRLLVSIICFSMLNACSCCPKECSCTNENRTVDCQGRNLTHIPDDIPAEVTVLFLGKNMLTDVPALSFAGMSNLKKLSLENNHDLSIDVEAFQSLQQLTGLVLMSAGVEDITGLFKGLFNLENLNARRNRIKFLRNGVFSDLKSLQYLNLNRNAISKIEYNVFNGLHNLRVLYFSENSIQEIHPKILDDLTSLIYLNINGNPLNCTCKIQRVKNFFLRHNKNSHAKCRNFNDLELLEIPDNTLCASNRDKYCLTSNMQILEGHVIMSARKRSLVDCCVTCFKNEHCNAFSFNKTMGCDIWNITHQFQDYDSRSGTNLYKNC